MENLNQINDDVQLIEYGDDTAKLSAKVTNVQIFDDTSYLEYIPEVWKSFINEDGSIGSGELQYIKYGDGINTLTDIVKSEYKHLKLVYVTTEYTNKGDESIYNTLYYATLLNLKHYGDKWYINQLYYDKSQNNDLEYDETIFKGLCVGFGGSQYYTPNFGGMMPNTIDELRPGEVFEVNYAWLIPENEIDDMYLNFGEVAYEFNENDLNMGYVYLNIEK
ncbi:MAG: hypothetical protein SPL51_04065 [Lachnospiraceae bacterium]|nr:hypothetical protein [Lachnospiraceae bacterium]